MGLWLQNTCSFYTTFLKDTAFLRRLTRCAGLFFSRMPKRCTLLNSECYEQSPLGSQAGNKEPGEHKLRAQFPQGLQIGGERQNSTSGLEGISPPLGTPIVALPKKSPFKAKPIFPWI